MPCRPDCNLLVLMVPLINHTINHLQGDMDVVPAALLSLSRPPIPTSPLPLPPPPVVTCCRVTYQISVDNGTPSWTGCPLLPRLCSVCSLKRPFPAEWRARGSTGITLELGFVRGVSFTPESDHLIQFVLPCPFSVGSEPRRECDRPWSSSSGSSRGRRRRRRRRRRRGISGCSLLIPPLSTARFCFFVFFFSKQKENSRPGRFNDR